MKKILIVLIVLFQTINLFGDENVLSLLENSKLADLDKAISIIKRNPSKYKNNDPVTRKLLIVFRKETQIMKEVALSGKRPSHYGEGHGEILGDLMFLIIQLDIADSVPTLIDWVGNSPKTLRTVVNYLRSESYSDMKTFDLINIRYYSNHPFYKSKKRGLLKLVCGYLNDTTKMTFNKKRNITRKMLLEQLDSKFYYDRKSALKCAKNFIVDKVIMSKVEKISRNDKYIRKTKGKTTYLVREEAKKVLALMKSD